MLRLQTSVFRDARQHPGADFFAVMKSEHEIWISWLGEGSVRARCPLYFPAVSKARIERALPSRLASDSCSGKENVDGLDRLFAGLDTLGYRSKGQRLGAGNGFIPGSSVFHRARSALGSSKRCSIRISIPSRPPRTSRRWPATPSTSKTRIQRRQWTRPSAPRVQLFPLLGEKPEKADFRKNCARNRYRYGATRRMPPVPMIPSSNTWAGAHASPPAP